MKKFIEKNSNEFNSMKASEHLWANIESALDKKQNSKVWLRSVYLAASIIIIFAFGYFLGRSNTKVNTVEEANLEQINSYLKFVDEKKSELNQYQRIDTTLYKNFSNDFAQLEDNFFQLKLQLEYNPNQKEILNAMIQNLEWQLDLLNRQNKVMEEIKAKKYESVI